MCSLCITAAALSAAGPSSGAGLIAVAANQLRTLKRWFSRGRAALVGQNRCPSS
jgi:hypothetical protein